MARQELRKPVDALVQERNKVDQELTSIKDEFEREHELMSKARADEFGAKEAIEALSPQASNNLPKTILRKTRDEARGVAELHSKNLDALETRKAKAQLKKKNLDKAIRELQQV